MTLEIICYSNLPQTYALRSGSESISLSTTKTSGNDHTLPKSDPREGEVSPGNENFLANDLFLPSRFENYPRGGLFFAQGS